MIDATLEEMFRCLDQGDPAFLPSAFWTSYNEKNLAQLDSEGLENFKRTVALNYFTWIPGALSDQLRYLLRHTTYSAWRSLLRLRVRDGRGPLRQRQVILLGLFTGLLWKYAERLDRLQILPELDEPSFGNPFQISLEGKRISQDIANSAIEFYAIYDACAERIDGQPVVGELGAGYGRNAFVFLRALPGSKYVIIDIPPALFVAQRYLTTVLPALRFFEFRCFDRIDQVEDELRSADVAFLLPHQAAQLPADTFDVFLNISSLQEMRPEQIDRYLALIDRVTSGFVYSKQWLVSENPLDGIVVRHDAYPVPARWRTVYKRTARVQTRFFEALYEVPAGD